MLHVLITILFIITCLSFCAEPSLPQLQICEPHEQYSFSVAQTNLQSAILTLQNNVKKDVNSDTLKRLNHALHAPTCFTQSFREISRC